MKRVVGRPVDLGAGLCRGEGCASACGGKAVDRTVRKTEYSPEACDSLFISENLSIKSETLGVAGSF